MMTRDLKMSTVAPRFAAAILFLLPLAPVWAQNSPASNPSASPAKDHQTQPSVSPAQVAPVETAKADAGSKPAIPAPDSATVAEPNRAQAYYHLALASVYEDDAVSEGRTDELNQAISLLLTRLNAKPFRKVSGSRESLFVELDKPALDPLPTAQYEYAEWQVVRLGINYHIQIGDHFYSAPYQLRKEKLDARLTALSVEFFHKHKRVASHQRSYKRGYTTVTDHMPKAHKEFAEWTPERLINWAAKTGESTAMLVHTILAGKVHPQQGFNSCMGIISLSNKYGAERVEAASKRALAIGGTSYTSLKSILANSLDSKPLPGQALSKEPVNHSNIRGKSYYH